MMHIIVDLRLRCLFSLMLCPTIQRQRVLRVFTCGSPPIFEIESTSKVKDNSIGGSVACPILEAFDLPTDLVYSYNQPWDPIVRLFSQYDPLYPLIDDLGEHYDNLFICRDRRGLIQFLVYSSQNLHRIGRRRRLHTLGLWSQ